LKLEQAKFHFIGIGGIGMCGLAELLHRMGATVTGSDMVENDQVVRLREMGVHIDVGHDADQVSDHDVVVYSSAVKANNVEFQAAQHKGVPLIPRAEALAEIMRLRRGLAVAGTHGKTTTTSLISSVFLSAQYDPSIFVGGRLELIQSTARLGDGDWIIAEADESDGSFQRLSPESVVITNIDSDHLDYYKSFQNLKRAFRDFALRIPFYGKVIACGDDENLRSALADFPKQVVYFGFDKNNDFRIVKTEKGYEFYEGKTLLGPLRCGLPGRHNTLNAAAAVIAGITAGVSVETGLRAVSEFSGVDRRFQHKGVSRGVDVYDDYGHHPTEVKAVLSGFKEQFPDRRLVVLFQPHRYSRTELCWSDFLSSFESGDRVYVTEIYPAGETPIEGIDSKNLVSQMKHNDCHFLPGESVVSQLKSELKSNDVFVTLGAGNVWKFGEELLRNLES
jgi:UDP-N-acetylmuramate--alanine ligase